MEATVVRLRGVEYPQLETDWEFGGSYPVVGGYKSWTNTGDLEAWRFMQSVQLIDYGRLMEDREPEAWVQEVGVEAAQGRFLDLENTVYLFTEVCEFVARLTEAADYEPRLTVEVTLRGAKGRRLVAGRRRARRPGYVCGVSAVPVLREVGPAEIRAGRREVAVDMAAELLQMFSFDTENRVLADIQQQLLLRRLR